MKIEGVCYRRRLRIELSETGVVVTTLSGEQEGSVFNYALAELKSRPDLVIDRVTTRYQTGWLGCILLFCLAGICAVNWGEGIATESFWVSIGLFPVSIFLIKTAPTKRIHLWQTNGGMQVFGIEEFEANKEEIQHFLALLVEKLKA